MWVRALSMAAPLVVERIVAKVVGLGGQASRWGLAICEAPEHDPAFYKDSGFGCPAPMRGLGDASIILVARQIVAALFGQR